MTPECTRRGALYELFAVVIQRTGRFRHGGSDYYAYVRDLEQRGHWWQGGQIRDKRNSGADSSNASQSAMRLLRLCSNRLPDSFGLLVNCQRPECNLSIIGRRFATIFKKVYIKVTLDSKIANQDPVGIVARRLTDRVDKFRRKAADMLKCPASRFLSPVLCQSN
uniref:Uncharacterized protein n=1 Tax=Macrostomum lignano TaxID=282301 RepID=A0A1I8FDK3_9PLAT